MVGLKSIVLSHTHAKASLEALSLDENMLIAALAGLVRRGVHVCGAHWLKGLPEESLRKIADYLAGSGRGV